ncbi:heparinase II/III domain-containing protein [Microlunatus sp. Y2014]|uniref:heparinase II/III domain-containing protein n=1 Tax=Microlunatus sp. Y2014 TaxID=3418488 RepID=UPI003DA7501D
MSPTSLSPTSWSRRTVLRTGGALALAASSGIAWRQVAVQAAPVANSLVPNGDFEQLVNGFPTSWRQFNTAVPASRVSSPVRSGASAVRLLDDTSAAMGLRSDRVLINAGKAHEATFWVHVTSGSPQVYLEFWNEALTRIHVETVKVLGHADWQLVTIRAVAPDDAARASLLIYSSSTNVGDATFDDVGLRELTAAELLDMPNADFEQVAGGVPSAWSQWVASVPYDSSDTVRHGGERSAHYATQSWSVKGGLRSSRVPVTAGLRYNAEVQTRAAQGGPVLGLEFWDAGNTRLAAYFCSPGRRSDQWYSLSTVATAPVGAVTASVMLYSTTAPTEVWYDDVVITEVTAEPVREHPIQVTGHPRYNLGPDDVPRLRQLVNRTEPNALGLVGQQLATAVITKAEGFVAETSITLRYYNGHEVTYPAPPTQPAPMPPPPGFTGKYPYWAALGLAVRTRLDTLACAYTLTGRADFADKISAYVTTLAGWDAWADPQFGVGPDQFTGYVTQAVATAYDQIHEALTDTERAQVVETLAGRGLDLIFADGVPGGGQIGGTAPTLAMGGLVLLGEDDRADRYLTRAEDMFRAWLDFRVESGQNEGFLYTAYSANPMTRSLAAMERVTGDTSLSRHRFLADDVWRWMLHSMAPGAGCAAFSDVLARGFLGTTMHYLNRFLDNGYAGWLLREVEFEDTHWDPMDKIYWYADDAVVAAPTELAPSAALPLVGEAHLRNGFTDEDALLSFRAVDSTYGHNHYNQNSFQLAIGGAWLGRDPGYRDLGTDGPTAMFSARDGHSTVLVDGEGQTQMGQGLLDRAFLGSGFDHVRGRAAGAYVRPALSQFDRHVMRIGPNRFVLLDKITSDEARRLTFQLLQGPLYQQHVGGAPVERGDRVTGTAFHAHNGAGELWGHSSDGADQTIGFVQYEGAEQYGQLLQIGGEIPVTSATRITTIEVSAVHDGAYLSASAMQDRLVTPATFIQHAGVTMLRSEDGNLELAVNVPADGSYVVDSVFMTGFGYGHPSLLVDGQPLGGSYDPGFFALVPGPAFRHGTIELTAGEHRLRYRTEPGSTGGTAVAVQSLRVVPAERADRQQDNGLTAEHLTGEGISGIHTVADTEVRTATFSTAGDVGWTSEWAVAGEGSGIKQLKSLRTDAEVAVVQVGRGRGAAALHRIGAMRVTRVEVGGVVLASTSAPVDLAVDASEAGQVAVEVTADVAGSIELRIGRRVRSADGRPVRNGRDPLSIVVDVPAGRTDIVLNR